MQSVICIEKKRVKRLDSACLQACFLVTNSSRDVRIKFCYKLFYISLWVGNHETGLWRSRVLFLPSFFPQYIYVIWLVFVRKKQRTHSGKLILIGLLITQKSDKIFHDPLTTLAEQASWLPRLCMRNRQLRTFSFVVVGVLWKYENEINGDEVHRA